MPNNIVRFENHKEEVMEKIEQYKKSIGEFIFSEFIVFVSQIVVFFMVAVFTSDFLGSEKRLAAYSSQKINDGSLMEILLTLLAILIVIGLFSAIGRIFDNKHIEFYVSEVLCEIPKTIYVFGSAASGAMLAITIFLYKNPSTTTEAQGFAVTTVMLAVLMFIYGCGLSYAFKRKTHVKPKP